MGGQIEQIAFAPLQILFHPIPVAGEGLAVFTIRTAAQKKIPDIRKKTAKRGKDPAAEQVLRGIDNKIRHLVRDNHRHIACPGQHDKDNQDEQDISGITQNAAGTVFHGASLSVIRSL